jgi:hypothetical protein
MKTIHLSLILGLAAASVTACGGAPQDDSTQSAQAETESEDSAAAPAAWVSSAEVAWATSFQGFPADAEVSRDGLPAAARSTFDNFSSGGETSAYRWRYQKRTGYFVFGLYNGDDSNITSLFDRQGNLLSTRDSPNGETVWVHPDGTSDDPCTNHTCTQ